MDSVAHAIAVLVVVLAAAGAFCLSRVTADLIIALTLCLVEWILTR